VRVVEFNVRFGDPETQSVLALLDSPLGELLHAAATGTLGIHPPLRWREGASVTVVVAAAGYPTAPRTGDAITGLEKIGSADVLHAGTALDDGRLVTSGGRVLAVTAVGGDLRSARQSAYDAVAHVKIDGGHYRRDIAAKAAEESK
ncbi:MAG: phosphoribosylglycinamide synthetase C domain-containing protein, partial [Mycobacteriales bacterium]